MSHENPRLRLTCGSYHGAATHYLHSSSLPDLENRLAELSVPDFATFTDRLRIINNTIAEFNTGLPHDQPLRLGGTLRQAIDRCFRPNNLESIIKALKEESLCDPADGKREPLWAGKTLKTLGDRSPTSLKTTLRQMELGRSWSIGEAFQREYEIASRFMEHPDFVEGVSKKLIEKSRDKPTWRPATHEEVTSEHVDDMLRPTAGNRALSLLKDSPQLDYMQYPHAWTGLPTENRVRAAVDEGRTRDDIIAQTWSRFDGKPGVREVLEDILLRKTTTQANRLRWIDEPSEESNTRQSEAGAR